MRARLRIYQVNPARFDEVAAGPPATPVISGADVSAVLLGHRGTGLLVEISYGTSDEAISAASAQDPCPPTTKVTSFEGFPEEFEVLAVRQPDGPLTVQRAPSSDHVDVVHFVSSRLEELHRNR